MVGFIVISLFYAVDLLDFRTFRPEIGTKFTFLRKSTNQL